LYKNVSAPGLGPGRRWGSIALQRYPGPPSWWALGRRLTGDLLQARTQCEKQQPNFAWRSN